MIKQNNPIDPPIEVLPQSMQDAIRAVEGLHTTPVEMSMSVALSIISYATQGLYNVDCLTFGNRPVSEFFFVLAGSGGAKSTVYNDLAGGIGRWETEALKTYQREWDDYQTEYEIWQQDWQSAKKIKDTDDRKSEMVHLKAIEPKAPLSVKRIVEQPTQVGLFRKLEKAEPSCALFTSEGGQFTSSHAFQGSDSSTSIHLATTLTKLWDGQPLSRDTSNESEVLRGRRFSLLVMAQDDIAASFLTNRQFQAQGLLARFMVTSCRKWELPVMDLSEEAEQRRIRIRRKLTSFHLAIFDLLKQKMPTGDNKQELELPVIGWDDEAKAHMQAWFNGTVHPVLSEGPFFARQLEHACRLSGMLAVFDGKEKISINHAKAGTALVDYYADQWRRLDLGNGDDRYADERPLADKLVEWMKHHNKTMLTKTDLHRSVPRALRDMNWEKQKKILSAMVAWEMIEEITIEHGNGRKAEAWQLV